MDISLMWIYSTYLKLKKSQLKLEKMEKLKIEQDDQMTELKEDDDKKESILKEIGFNQIDYDKVLFKIFYSLQQRDEQKDM